MYSFLCCEFALSHRVPVPSRSKSSAPSLRFLVRFFSILFSPRACIFFDVKVTDSRGLNKKKRKKLFTSHPQRSARALESTRRVQFKQRANGRCEKKEITIRRRAETQ